MDAYDAIYARRTTRDFQEREIPPETVKRILAAGLRAPSNDHMRQWEFVIINGRVKRRQVIEKIKKNFTRGEVARFLDGWGAADDCQRAMYFDGVPKQYKMLLTAGCLIVACFRQTYPLLKPKSLSDLNGLASVWCCVENILIAAAAEGIQGVTRIPFPKEIKHLKETLSIPADYEIACYIALGYPAADAKEIQQIAVEVEERMHFNGW